MELIAKKRTLVGHKVKKLRKEGLVPATVYGKKVKSENLEIDLKKFLKVFASAGDTKLVDLRLEGEKTLPVLIHQVQRHPVEDYVLHVDFLAVDLKTAVRVHVPIIPIGESPAITAHLGALLHPLQELEIECLPADLPPKIEVDISNLKELGNSIKVSDIKVSDKIKVLTNADQVVLTIGELVQKEKVEEVVTPTEVEATAEKKSEEGAEAAPTETTPAGKGVEGEKKPAEKKVEGKKEEKKK